MAHKLGVGHVNIHRAGFGAKATVAAAARVAANTEHTHHAQHTALGTTYTEIIAERTIEEEAYNKEQNQHHQECRSQLLSFQQGAQAASSMKHSKGNTQHGQEIKDIASQL